MIRALALLLACQLSGEIFARALGLPIPGPVIGLALLVIGVLAHARATGADPSQIEGTELGRTAGALLGSLGLLFVPAGVGVVQQLPVVGAYGVGLAAALIGSTVLTLIVTVYVFLWVKRLTGKARPTGDEA